MVLSNFRCSRGCGNSKDNDIICTTTVRLTCTQNYLFLTSWGPRSVFNIITCCSSSVYPDKNQTEASLISIKALWYHTHVLWTLYVAFLFSLFVKSKVYSYENAYFWNMDQEFEQQGFPTIPLVQFMANETFLFCDLPNENTDCSFQVLTFIARLHK